MQENSGEKIWGEIKGVQLGDNVGEKLGEKTGEKLGESLGQIHKLKLCPAKLAPFIQLML